MQLKFLISQGIIGCKKTVVPMRFLLLTITLCFLITGNGYSQTITLSLKKVSLEKAFKEIKKQSGYNFVYTRDQIKKSNSVSIQLKSASLKQVLDSCFINQPLTYVIDEKHVIIKDRGVNQSSASTTNPPIILRTHITGKVVNDKGEALIGATVAIVGSNKATATNENGEFRIAEVESDAIILVTSVGYLPVKIKSDGRTNYIIKMEPAISSLDETVIIAYGTTTKRLNTGSVSRVTKEEIERQPVTNPLSAIQGRMSGVFVNTENGMPGGNIKVQIRGRGSINAGTDPLYIIDGVPFISEPLNYAFGLLSTGISGSTSPLNILNPNDIESIEVLKDADATAIYGSRAANGVILITTKKGGSGKTKVDLNISQGVSSLSVFPALLNLKEYLKLRREAFENDNITPTVSNAPDLLVWDTTHYTDWPRYLLGGKAFLTNGQISVSGGNEMTSFLVSASGRREGTVLPGDQYYMRGGMNFSIRHTSSNKKFRMEFSSNVSFDKNKSLPSTISSFLTLPPNIPVYDKLGNFNWLGMVNINPESALLQNSISQSDNLLGNLNLTYKFSPELEFRTSFGYNKIQMDQIMTFPTVSLNPAYGQMGYAYYGENKNNSVIVEPQLEYSKRFNNSDFKILIGTSWQQNLRTGSFLSGSRYSNEQLLESMSAAGQLAASNLYSLYRYASIFGRINYGFKQKYLLNITGRRDGSSRFGPQNQYGNFGSAGLAWIFNKESLFQRYSFLSFGKLRASYGITGNDQIKDYQYHSTYGISGEYSGIVGLAPSQIQNSAFGWESNRKLEAALELGFIKDKLLFSVSWFKNKSGNQLIDYPLPYMSGPFGRYQANLPALIENSGWELEWNVSPVRKNEISLAVFGNITIPQNRLLKYPGLNSSAFANSYVIGEDLSIVKALHFSGVNSSNGLPEFEDLNKDGKLTFPEDFGIVGKTAPYFFGGFGSDLSISNFTFNIFFQFSKQYAQGITVVPGRRPNTFDIALNRWQKEGDITTIPKATTGNAGPYSMLSNSDYGFFNASYLRLKSISLAYNISAKLVDKIGISDFRIFLDAQNLMTWKKKGAIYDPEAGRLGIAPMKYFVGGIKLSI